MNARPYISLILSTLLVLLPASALASSTPREDGVKFPMKYEGGSLQLNQHDKLTVYVGKTQVVMVQGKTRFAVPVSSITEVNYGQDVHRRVGEAVGVGVVTLGIGALLLLVKTKKHYVGMIWAEPNAAAAVSGASDGNSATAPGANGGKTTDKKGGIVFKVGKGDYRGFMTALEGVTGKQAVNADSVGSGGTSK